MGAGSKLFRWMRNRRLLCQRSGPYRRRLPRSNRCSSQSWWLSNCRCSIQPSSRCGLPSESLVFLRAGPAEPMSDLPTASYSTLARFAQPIVAKSDTVTSSHAEKESDLPQAASILPPAPHVSQITTNISNAVSNVASSALSSTLPAPPSKLRSSRTCLTDRDECT